MIIVGCVALSPIVDEIKPVSEVSNPDKTVSIPEGMVFYDSRPPTQGIRFPEGIYVLEAEDEDYFYFRSPKPLEFKSFQGKRIVNEEEKNGGLTISKKLFKMMPAGGYVNAEEGNKRLVWKLGSEFLSREGKSWERNYE